MRINRACDAIGRNPAEVVKSAAMILCVGISEAEVSRRAEAIGRPADDLRRDGLAGTPDQVLTKLATFADAGIERMYLQVLNLQDLDHVAMAGSDLIAEAAAL